MNTTDQQFEEDFKLVFATPKKGRALSLQAMATRIKQHSMSAARENQVVFKITSFAQSRTAIGKTVKYNSRDGSLDLFDNMDNALDVKEDTPIYKDFANEVKWLNTGQHKTKRLTMNFVLSLSEVASKPGFEEATRHFLNEHFGSQPYLYTFHDDTDHYHAHVVAGLRNYEGERVITDKPQLLIWRQGFAESLRLQGIVAEATPSLSRGNVSKKTKLHSKQKALDSENSPESAIPSPAQPSIDKRYEAWKRIHLYMKQNDLDGVNELNDYIKDTYRHRNYALEQDL